MGTEIPDRPLKIFSESPLNIENRISSSEPLKDTFAVHECSQWRWRLFYGEYNNDSEQSIFIHM